MTFDQIDSLYSVIPSVAVPYRCSADVYFVYMLINDADIIYIGISNDVHYRLSQHRLGIGGTDKKTFSHYWKVQVGDKKTAMRIERMLIKKHSPLLNKQHGSGPSIPESYLADPDKVRWLGNRKYTVRK